MKILQIIHKKQTRGAEIFTCQLSNHLIKSGHEVKIVSLYDGEAELSFNGEIILLNASIKKRLFDILAWKRLAGIIEKFKPHVVQTNAGDTLKYAVFSKKLFRWKTPVIARNASIVGNYLKTPLQKELNSFLYKSVSSIISVSRDSEKDILSNFPFLTGSTCVIPIGLEADSPIKKSVLKPRDRKHIIHVGGFSFEKNHFGLLRIFRLVLKHNLNVHLHLIGDGPLKAKVEAEVKKMDLEQNISFFGFVNNPMDFINNADILVLPSIIEGLPGVLLEAMYCKTPIVAYDVGGISEILGSETGSLIEKDDEEEFAKAISSTLTNFSTKQIENAYELVINKYMNTTIAKEFLEVYEAVLNEGSL